MYEPRYSKATNLYSPALSYIHLLSDTLTVYEDSTGVVSWMDFNNLLSMVNGFHLHLGYEVTLALHYYGADPRIGVIFSGPYITLLIQGMGLQEG